MSKIGARIFAVPTTRFKNKQEAEEIGIWIKNVYIDDRFIENHIETRTEFNSEYDLALIELSNQIKGDFTIVNLRSPPASITNCVLIGYGNFIRSQGEHESTDQVQQKYTSCLPFRFCNTKSTRTVYNSDEMMCSASARSSMCQGDSGGPVFENRSDNVLNQYGVNSFDSNCAAGVDSHDWHARVDGNYFVFEFFSLHEFESPIDYVGVPGDLRGKKHVWFPPYYADA